MRLQRFFVTGFPPGTESLVSEFLLFHGIGSVTVTDRPDREKLQIDCFYNSKGGRIDARPRKKPQLP